MNSPRKPASVSANASTSSTPRSAFGFKANVKLPSTSATSTPRRQPTKSEIPEAKQAAINVPPPPLLKKSVDTFSDEDDVTGATSGLRNYRGGGDFITLPLECLSKAEIKESIKHAKLMPYGFRDEEEENTGEEAEDQMNTVFGPDRARFNVWKGQNYDLHVLGDFKSDFDKRVKAFQKPDMGSILLDPFCRDEDGLKEEPARADGFIVWKSRAKNWDYKTVGVAKIPKKRIEYKNQPYQDTGSSAGDDITTSDESDSDAESCRSTISIEDPEIKEYIKTQKKKRKQGLNVSGETIYYDEDFQIIRNLHRDSYSMTNYGTMPDEKCIGKAHIFYPEMTLAEKNMLQPIIELERDGKNILPKKKSSKTVSAKPPPTKGKQTETFSAGKKSTSSKESGDFVAQKL
ncbi:unnamed protein product [Orchesella dallaii]|uniref:Uncharacterized protein n=1 Tax=Orchesella dallaii TaxID=48710 RepID=A0ABP1S1W9_9HEXA